MTAPNPSALIPYHVEISNVHEVCLFGSADLRYWKKHLEPAGLHPASINGSAQVLISVIAARFKGLAFREFSICISVSREEDEPDEDGFYLAQAFNSRRFFAFVERAMFHTPYHHARIELGALAPARMRLTQRQTKMVEAEMSALAATPREPSITEDFSWEGPVFLPRNSTTDKNRLFYARLKGPRQSYPFLPQDRWSLSAAKDYPIFQSLLDSNFTPKTWTIRRSATHAKSKTISQELPGFPAAAAAARAPALT